ncbi:MAG: DoxX family protein [Chryseolinea sp.]
MKAEKIKIVSFWILTLLLCFELVYGALWDFNVVNKNYAYEVLNHLGYPLYIALILGWCKLLATIVIILPGLPLQKEWAYAGVVILFGGAFVSHLLSGDTIGASSFALGFGILSVLSWLLRPSSRRIANVQTSQN